MKIFQFSPVSKSIVANNIPILLNALKTNLITNIRETSNDLSQKDLTI